MIYVHCYGGIGRTGGVTIISGFHSPVQVECLAVALGGGARKGPRQVKT